MLRDGSHFGVLSNVLVGSIPHSELNEVNVVQEGVKENVASPLALVAQEARNVAVISISKSKGEKKEGMEVDVVTDVQLCDFEPVGVINIICSTSLHILEKQVDTQ
ncbi:hypothetical protein V6N13_003357 [Hibiscus sabdariffa]|uniref:Uncharacterized protein n=2 Tax=Hibiscus sabdariffa TaxID=183260 RepID=A0ABR2NRS3_9ROSI